MSYCYISLDAETVDIISKHGIIYDNAYKLRLSLWGKDNIDNYVQMLYDENGVRGLEMHISGRDTAPKIRY